jgi:anti-anti-sigma factor
MMQPQVRTFSHRGIPVVALEGEIDLSNVTSVHEQMLAAAPNTALGLIVDLAGATYLDSQGIRILFELRDRLRIRRQGMALVVPEPSPIREILVLTSMDTVVPLFKSVDEAGNHLWEEGQPPVFDTPGGAGL